MAEVGSRMASRRYLGATPICALRTISRTLYSMRVEIEANGDVPLCSRRYGSNGEVWQSRAAAFSSLKGS